MQVTSFLFLILGFVSSKSYYVNFVGNDSELSYCQNALNVLNSNKQEFCETYATSFDFNCSNEDTITLTCELNYLDLPSDTNYLIFSIGSTENTSIDVSTIPSGTNISISPFQNSNENLDQCATKGSVQLAKRGSELTIKIKQMTINFSNNFYAKKVILISCDIQSDTDNSMNEIIIDSCTALKNPNKKLDAYNLILNITSDSPAIISFTEDGYNFSIGNQNYLISKSISNYAYLYSRTKHVTFHNDQSNPDLLKKVGLAYSGTEESTITITKSGNWPHSLQKQLEVNAKYPSDKIIIDKNDRRFIIVNDDYDYNHDYQNYYYVIAHGEELEKCGTIRDEIAADKETNCPKYELTYMIQCDDDFVLICEEDDKQFANMPNVGLLSISFESNQTVIDLSLIPKADMIQIGPIGFLQSPDLSTAISIKGSNVNCNYLAFGNSKINKIDCDIKVNHLHLYLCEILESQFHLFAETLECDQYFMDNYSPNRPPIANVYQPDDGFDYYFTITFTKDKLNVIFYDYDGYKKELFIPYNIVNMFCFGISGDRVTFNVDDASTALLRPIKLQFYGSSNKITFIQTGEWEKPLKGPLNISLIDNSFYLYYDTSLLDSKWFNFDIQDMYEEPPQPEQFYNYFIGNGEELQLCNTARDDIKYNDRCQEYENVFELICEQDVNLICKENDFNFKDIPSNGYVTIIVGTNAPTIDLSRLLYEQKILLTPFKSMQQSRNLNMKSVSRPNKREYNKLNIKEDSDQIADVSIKGTKVNADSLYISDLNIKLTENNLTTNKLLIYGSKVVSIGFYIKSEFIYIDESTLSSINHLAYIQSNAFDLIDLYDGNKFYNFTVNFTEDSWHVYAEVEYYDSIRRHECIIPYWTADRIYSIVYGENMTFNVDDPNTAKLKSVEIITSQPNFTFYSTGNWEDPLEKPLNVYLDRNINVSFLFDDSLKKEWFNFHFYSDDTETPSPSDPPIETPDNKETESISQSEIPDNKETESISQSETPDNKETESISQSETPDNKETESISQSETPDNKETDSISQAEIPDNKETESISQSETPDNKETESISQAEISDEFNENHSDPPKPDHPTSIPTKLSQTYIIVSDDEIYCSKFKQLVEFCKENPTQKDCDEYNNVKSITCSNGQNINNELLNVDSDVLIMQLMKDIPDLNLNQLKIKIPVSIYAIPHDYDDEEGEDEYSKLLNIKTKMMNKKNRKNIKSDEFEFIKVGIRGNIRDKVSFLETQSISLEAKNDPLNVQNLRFLDSIIDPNSQLIHATHFIVSEFSHEQIIANSQSKIKVSQYAIEDFYYFNDEYEYRISYASNQWNLLVNNGNGEYKPFFEDAPSYVPYSFCDTLSLIMISHHFDLYIESNEITTAKAVNITLLNSENLDDSKLLEEENYPVKITTSGNWDKITNKVSVYFTANQKSVSLDTSGCNSKVQIDKFDFSDLPEEPPVPIDDTTKKDNVNLGEVIIDKENKEPGKLKEDIEKLFKEKNNTVDVKSDHVIKIVSEPNEQIEFKDLSLGTNQYIKVDNNANVKLSSGQLNLVLDKDSSSVSVKVENNEDVKLSIKNMNECVVKIETENNEKKNIAISSNSEVYGHLQFEVGENVESISIDSINLHETGSVSSKVPITVNNIAAQPQTTGKLTNVVISKEFSISQSAVLELDDVSLSSAKVNLNLHTYSSSNYNVPMLNGTLGNPPSSIALIKPQNDDSKPSENQEFLLFQGTFTNKCDDWKDIIDYGDTNFNDGVCREISSLVFLKEEKSLKVFYNSKKDDGGKQDNDNKLTGGQIAGIVLGCIAGVAIIVGVVVFLVIKKKKSRNSSDESANEQQVDL